MSSTESNEPTAYPSSQPAHSSAEDSAPQFGALDIVEAFTAMRHEWRGQTKESRLLAEQIQAAVASLQSLESNLTVRQATPPESGNQAEQAGEIKSLVILITEIDHQLTRAISVITDWEITRQKRTEADQRAVEQYFFGMNSLARWFARPLLDFIAAQREPEALSAENPAIEGLNLILARLRRDMKELDVVRLDTLGQLFDANTMHAIGTIATNEYPDGVVADQLSPAYLWQGQILRFADVRVARSES